MQAFKIIVLFVCLSIISTQVTWNDIESCVVNECVTEYTVCHGDNICSQALSCIDNCGVKEHVNQTCLHNCSTPAYSSAAFWSLDLCFLHCLTYAEMEKGYVKELTTCEHNCSKLESLCLANTQCLQTVQCTLNCGQNVTCTGECLAGDYEDQELLNLYHCQADCLLELYD